jgi:hypothetical protein
VDNLRFFRGTPFSTLIREISGHFKYLHSYAFIPAKSDENNLARSQNQSEEKQKERRTPTKPNLPPFSVSRSLFVGNNDSMEPRRLANPNLPLLSIHGRTTTARNQSSLRTKTFSFLFPHFFSSGHLTAFSKQARMDTG